MDGSAALRLANVVCALILVATTPQACSLGASFTARHDPIVEQLDRTLRDVGGQSRVEHNLAGACRRK